MASRTFTLTATTAEGLEAARQADRTKIMAVLGASGGNIGVACKTLGVSRSTLERRLKALELTEWVRSSFPLAVRQPRKKKVQ